jgi:hypothetical protein
MSYEKKIFFLTSAGCKVLKAKYDPNNRSIASESDLLSLLGAAMRKKEKMSDFVQLLDGDAIRTLPERKNSDEKNDTEAINFLKKDKP